MKEEIIRLAEDMIRGDDEARWYRNLQWCLKCENQIQKNKIVREVVDDIHRNCEFTGGLAAFALGVLIYENDAIMKVIDESKTTYTGEKIVRRLIFEGYGDPEYLWEYIMAFKEFINAGINYGLNLGYLVDRFLDTLKGKYMCLKLRYLPILLDYIRFGCYLDDSDIRFIVNAVYCSTTLNIAVPNIFQKYPPVKLKSKTE